MMEKKEQKAWKHRKRRNLKMTLKLMLHPFKMNLLQKKVLALRSSPM